MSFFRLKNCSCKMNMELFPYDTQHCNILLRSPHYMLSDLQYYVYEKRSGIVLWTPNTSHALWQVTGQQAKLTGSNVAGIQMWFRLQRKPSFYVWTLLVPTATISLATVCHFFCLLPSLIFNHEKVLAFLLPHNSGEKMQTIFTGNLAYFLLLTTMIELTPHTSEHIPILAKFFVLIIGVGMFGAMLCACVIRLHKANDSKGNRNKRRCCISARTLNDIFFIMLVLHILKTKSWD